ncbi:potassium-transporting ATPase subunit KdpA [Clostridioides difficile]
MKNKKQGWVVFGAMSIIFLIGLVVCFKAESAGNPILSQLGLN